MSENGSSDVLMGFSKPKTYTVSQLNSAVHNTLEGAFDEVLVDGEIGNFTRAKSGHLYFTLKDAKSQVKCVMWRGMASYLRFEPEPGMQVLVKASLTVYEPRGEYQLSCRLLEPVGVGALQKAFEQLKKKLEAEGLFDPEKKIPLPFLPQSLGIVTSPSGAAIKDVLTVLNRRYPNIHVIIYPCQVQGTGAAAEIKSGIETLDKMAQFDVLIVTRGGGSIEDLWAFNDEEVVRAIAACKTPVISAIGHEIDFTLCDFVADVRAPTPSSAAEIVVGRKDDLLTTIQTKQRRIQQAILARLSQIRSRLQATKPSRMLVSIARLLETTSQNFDSYSFRLQSGMHNRMSDYRNSLSKMSSQLEVLSPLRALGRGYGIVTQTGGRKPITSVKYLSTGDSIDVTLADGKLTSRVEKKVEGDPLE